jgi:hypothetical protein
MIVIDATENVTNPLDSTTLPLYLDFGEMVDVPVTCAADP